MINYFDTGIVVKLKKCQFKNDKGDSIEYNQPVVVVDGVEFYLYPSKEKKDFFKHCLKKELGV